MPETISIEKSDHITTIWLEKPTMPPKFFAELGAAFSELDGDVRAVVVRSRCKHFTYGLDLTAAAQDLGAAFSGGTAAPRMELFATVRRLQGYIDAVAACPVPVIAAVHGWCIGGGVDLLAACDIRYATEDARFSVRETRIAIVADLGSLQRLPPIIGEGHTRELAFTGKDIDAERARAIGLVNDVAADQDELEKMAMSTARQIAENAPLTVRGVKQVLDFGRSRRVADGLEFVAAWNSAFLASEDLGEAMSAFLAKRAPEFKGR